jgi:hypothetical protein
MVRPMFALYIIAQILLSRKKVERHLQCRRGVNHGVDNASCESFIKTLKREEIYANKYADMGDF